MYPVTDYCLGVHAYGTASTVKLEQVIDLMYAGLRHGGKAEGTVVLKVKLWDDGDTVAAYRDQAWAPLGACVFTKQTARFTLLDVPPRPAVSHRSV